MDVVKELRNKIKGGSGIKNFGVGLDINKLIVLLNDFRMDIQRRDRDISVLRSRILRYKSALCEVLCKNYQTDGTCTKHCSQFDDDYSCSWCDEVKEAVRNYFKDEDEEERSEEEKELVSEELD